MDITLIIKALILGIVEGLTEFLPISSTGHLIIVGSLLNFNDAHGKMFEVAIQSGAILAVCWIFRTRLWHVLSGLKRNPISQRFAGNVVLASIPVMVLAFLFGNAIKSLLFNPLSVASAFIVGGLIILWVERTPKPQQSQYTPTSPDSHTRIHHLDDLGPFDAFKVGLMQCFALIPGTSRSGATIIGGMLLGLSRQVATEFSFFMAIPVLFSATAYELFKARHVLQLDQLGLLALGFAAAFIAALACVRWLMRFIIHHHFRGFAWYRIIFGLLIFFATWQGFVQW